MLIVWGSFKANTFITEIVLTIPANINDFVNPFFSKENPLLFAIQNNLH